MSFWVGEFVSLWVIEFISLWVFEPLSWWVHEFLSSWVYKSLSLWIGKFMSLWVGKFMSYWVIAHPKPVSYKLHEPLSSWVFEFLISSTTSSSTTYKLVSADLWNAFCKPHQLKHLPQLGNSKLLVCWKGAGLSLSILCLTSSDGHHIINVVYRATATQIVHWACYALQNRANGLDVS